MLERVGNPIRIVADTTRRCNLDCWYCHSTSGPRYEGPELEGKDICNIYKAAEESRVFDITITGGEPLMWKSLDGAMDASGDLGYSALQIITNATLVDERRLQTLRRGKLSRIAVSLDGKKETHEGNRGKNTYERTIRGIRALKSVVDNITVISVLDNTNFDKWPELTYSLAEIGIKQHHLTPVCFAGEAMDLYRGLTNDQFNAVRKTVNQLIPTLPEGFILVFNDILINDPNTRTIPINSFNERFKGWQFVTRPDGKANVAVRSWGRSWRENETLGNIKEESLAQIISRTTDHRRLVVSGQFGLEEERKRKFHHGGPTQDEIEKDRKDVQIVEAGVTEPAYKHLKLAGVDGKSDYEEIFLLPMSDSPRKIAELLISQPERYRLRNEQGFGFLFDRVTFNITLLRQEELAEIDKILSKK